MKTKIFYMFTILLLSQVALSAHFDENLTNTEVKEFPRINSCQLIDLLQKQLKAIRENDITNAYKDSTSKEFRNITSLDNFRNFVQTHDVLLHNKTLEINSLLFEHDNGTLKGTLTSDSGTKADIEYDFIQEHGEWRILGIEIFKQNKR